MALNTGDRRSRARWRSSPVAAAASGREMVLAMARAGADVAITSRKVEIVQGRRRRGTGDDGPPGVRPRVPRRALGRGRRARRRHLRRVRPGRRARQQRRHVAAVPGPRQRLRGAVRQGRRRQPQGPVPARRARRRPHGRRRRRLDHQRQQRRRHPPDPARAAVRRRQGRPRHPHDRLRPGLRPEGAGEHDPVRAVLHRHLRGVGQGGRRRRCSPAIRSAAAATRTRSSAPRCTWRATRRASPPGTVLRVDGGQAIAH